MNAVLSPEVMEIILRRSATLGATKSQYVALIIQAWVAAGCAPVNAQERQVLATPAEAPVPASPEA